MLFLLTYHTQVIRKGCFQLIKKEVQVLLKKSQYTLMKYNPEKYATKN